MFENSKVSAALLRRKQPFSPGMSRVAEALGEREPRSPDPFVWGEGGEMLSPSQVKQRRAVTDALMERNMGRTATNLGEGIEQLGTAAIGAWQRGQLEEAEQVGSAERQRVMDALMGLEDPTTKDIYGALGNEWVGSDPSSVAVLNALLSEEQQQANWAREDADPLRQLQIERAEMEVDALRNPKPEAPDLPASVDEYVWYAQEERAKGREPLPFIDFQQAQKGGGLQIETLPDGTTRVTQGGPGGAYGRKVDADMGGIASDIQKEAINAVSALDTIDAMEQAMADPNFYSGFGAPQVLQLKRFAAALGINPDSVVSTESFNALASQSVLDLMGGSLGAGVSNADREFVVQQTANLDNSPEGNRKLLETQRKLYRRKQEMALFARDYAKQNGGRIDDGFSSALAEWAEQNPLFSEDDQIGEGTVIEDANGNQLVLQDGQWVPF